MSQAIELNQGEIKITFSSPSTGKVSFKDLGIQDEDLNFQNGLIRLVFDFEGIDKLHYYQVPVIGIAYRENMAEIHWQCEFNNETILDKTDHHGHSSVILLDRKKLTELENHHQNALIVHGEFPEPAHLIAEECYINFFQ